MRGHRGDLLRDLNGIMDRLRFAELWGPRRRRAPVGGWLVPTLLNGWTHAPEKPLRYRIDPWGFVHLRGAVVPGGQNTDAFNLPDGYRPERTIWLGGALVTATDGTAPALCAMTAAGNFFVGPYSGAFNRLHLDGVVFRRGGFG